LKNYKLQQKETSKRYNLRSILNLALKGLIQLNLNLGSDILSIPHDFSVMTYH